MKKIILAGNALTAQVLHGYLIKDGRYQIAGLTVDDQFVDDGGIEGYKIAAISKLLSIFNPDEYQVIMAMGYSDLNRKREIMFKQLKILGFKIETYIHPDARVYTNLPIGEGSVILPGAVIEPKARIGMNSMIWSNVTLAHHSSIGDHCWLAAGVTVSGQSTILDNSFLGVNSTIVNKVTIGEYNLIGAGAMISRNTKNFSVHLARSAETLRYSSNDYIKYFGI